MCLTCLKTSEALAAFSSCKIECGGTFGTEYADFNSLRGFKIPKRPLNPTRNPEAKKREYKIWYLADSRKEKKKEKKKIC